MGQLPVSRTGAVVSVDIPANQTSLVALPLVEIVHSGKVTAVSGSVITVSGTVFDVLANPHAIKVTSRSNQLAGSTNAYGCSAQITAQSGSDVTAALATAPNVGDEVVIYRLETISSLFGAANTAGFVASGTSAGADIIYIENGGTLTGYFYKNTTLGGGIGWRATSDLSTDQANTVIPPNKGLLVIRTVGGSPVSITFTGDTLPANEKATVVAGFNILNNPFTVPTTLDGSFLKDYITGGGSAGGADIVYVENAGTLTGYFYKNTTLGGTGWRLASGGSVDQGSVAISPGKAILFSEQQGAAEFTLPEPFAE
jgi:hypothetical protein